jgi:hypothetical protein
MNDTPGINIGWKTCSKDCPKSVRRKNGPSNKQKIVYPALKYERESEISLPMEKQYP